MRKNLFEVKRQVFHAFFGIILAVLVFYRIATWPWLLGIVTVGILVSYVVKEKEVPVLSWFIRNFERKELVKKFPAKGAIYYFMGAFVVAALFEPDIAAASLMILALGDSICVVVGNFGRIKHPFSSKKYLEGAIAGFVAGVFGAYFFVSLWEAIAASFFAMIVEGIELEFGVERVDDNLIIPPAAALVIYFMRLVI